MIYLNCDDNPTTLNKKNYLLRAAARLGLEHKVQPWVPIIGECDYVLNIEPFGTFVKGRKWTGIWEIDLLMNRQETGRDWVLADDVFIAISSLPERLSGMRHRTRLLFQAVDVDLHKRRPEIEQEFDFVICHSTHPPLYAERVRVFDILRGSYKYLEQSGGRRPEDYIGSLNAGKIQVIRSMNTEVEDGELAQRFFECLAIGPVLTNYVPDLMYTGLVENKDYFAYRDDQDLLDKMNILLESQDFRDQIATNGRRKALLLHTYEHRLISILNICQQYQS